ncbi:hypothetical protein WJX72_010860 [[Myrmecia] bisecta]|uniref:Uncharacterized protein n=1 Tax=[Myrmecia] bisecta TaxID=41462 RepID=A0AAW1R998_9CHLO
MQCSDTKALVARMHIDSSEALAAGMPGGGALAARMHSDSAEALAGGMQWCRCSTEALAPGMPSGEAPAARMHQKVDSGGPLQAQPPAAALSRRYEFEGCVDHVPPLQDGEKMVLGHILSPPLAQAFDHQLQAFRECKLPGLAEESFVALLSPLGHEGPSRLSRPVFRVRSVASCRLTQLIGRARADSYTSPKTMLGRWGKVRRTMLPGIELKKRSASVPMPGHQQQDVVRPGYTRYPRDSADV